MRSLFKNKIIKEENKNSPIGEVLDFPRFAMVFSFYLMLVSMTRFQKPPKDRN